MSLLSFDDKALWCQTLNNLWALKILHNTGIEVSDIPIDDHIFERLLKRVFQEVEIVEREVRDEDWYGDEGNPYFVLISDERLLELSKIGNNEAFSELAGILDKLPNLNDWEYYRDWPPIEDWEWRINEEGHVLGLILKYWDTTPHYRQEAKVLANFHQKLNEVLRDGHVNRNHG